MQSEKTTAVANSNIAIIKYWGKRDARLNLPQNSSISFTMDAQLSTLTTVEFSAKLKHDELLLNNARASSNETGRVSMFLDLIRAQARIKQKAKVVSGNSFPKGAGLASSASGFAALAAAASKAAGLKLDDRELSALARRGSGSASRSIFGGAVEWQAGTRRDGKDSVAIERSPSFKWDHLRNVVAIISSQEKKVSSRAGMEETVRTSKLFRQRLKDVEKRLDTVRKAIAEGDFEAMAETIMQDSNSMHAVMLDTWPPIRYMNDVSWAIVEEVLAFNADKGKAVAAYTFDAGPNAHVYTTEKYAKEIEARLVSIPGVQKTMVCQIGEGIRYRTEHLF